MPTQIANKHRDPARHGKPVIDPRHTSFRLVVKKSRIHRWGVYAGEPIPKNCKVIEYTGERCNRKETKRRAEGKLHYMFTLDAYWSLDGAVGGSGAEFINHCCTPNLYSKIFKGHILYMSLRDIKPGEELTIDYRFEPHVEKVPCKCGAADCRGTINLKKSQ
jgi:uncharacterized protein